MLLFAGLNVIGGLSLIGYLYRKRKVKQQTTEFRTQAPMELREQQLQNISSADDMKENLRVQRADNRNIKVASFTVLLASAGAVFSPVLTMLSLGGIFYVGKNAVIDGYRLFVNKGILGVDALSSLIKILLVINAQIVLCSVSVLVYACNRKLMHMVKDNSKKKVIDAFRQFPRTVFILENPEQDPQGQIEIKTDLAHVKIGDIVIVNPGELIPVDGMIEFGCALVDQHILNGETQLIEREPGDTVFALTVLLSGRIGVRTQRTGEQTTAAQIAQTLTKTVEYKTDMQLWAESLTNKTVFPMILAGTAVAPWVGLSNAAAFLYSHPKYKTTLVCSISLLTTLNQASQQGILVKDGRTFELLEQIDTVVFDKTGTLTAEQPEVKHIYANACYDEDTVLRLAAAAEHRQTHPIAQAIIQAAEVRQLSIPEVEQPEYQLGLGLTAQYQGKPLCIGSLRFIVQQAKVDESVRQHQERCHQDGHTLIGVTLDGEVIGVIELHVQVRPEAKAVIQGLRQRGIQQIYIISGDHTAPTARLADQLGIDHYFAETLPEQKADIIDALQQEGKSICYIGDGINDAIALKKAKVSISLSGASTVAMDSAQAILMDQTLNQLCPFFDLVRASQRNMKSSVAIVVAPHVISAASALLIFSDAFAPAMVITLLALFGGVANALRPQLINEPHAHSEEEATAHSR